MYFLILNIAITLAIWKGIKSMGAEYMEGVTFIKEKNIVIAYISEFSEELKDNIRQEFRIICHGISVENNKTRLYSYENTIEQFMKRYPENSPVKQKGMIGELLLNVIIRLSMKQYKVISPFFNMEEMGSAKKGFDIVLYDEENTCVWITESKSGEPLNGVTNNQMIRTLIHRGKRDLKERLGPNHDSLWLNAINGARISLEKPDLKESVVNILSTQSSIDLEENNVILGANLFSEASNKFDEDEIYSTYNLINEDSLFRELKIIAIQKSTYIKIVEFLKSEVQS